MEKLLNLSNWLQKLINFLDDNVNNEMQTIYGYLIKASEYMSATPKPNVELPTDMLISIASELPVNQVNRFFKDLRIKLDKSDVNRLWYLLFNRDFDKRPFDLIDWEKLYQDFYQHVGYVYSFGNNFDGQLGFGDIINRYVPTKMIPDVRSKYVSCGGFYSMFTDINGELYGCGINYDGQLGLGDLNNRLTPTKITINNRPIKPQYISCGLHTLLIVDNEVYSFGENNYGQLGLGYMSHMVNIPTKIIIDGKSLKAKNVSCGGHHTVLIDENNEVRSFGLGYTGRLGLGDENNRNNPTKIILGNSPLKAKSVSCGEDHTIIIDENDEVYSFGYNGRGQLGLGHFNNMNTPTKIMIENEPFKAKHIYCGGHHTIMIDKNDEVYSFGFNEFGQLGLGHFDNINIPTKILINGNPFRIKHGSCGGYHTVLVDKNNQVYSFGINRSGESGIGDKIFKVNTPTKLGITAKYVSCGYTHTMLIV